jgi:hypothetical protein
VLLVPGLLLFLWMFAALAGLLPADAISTLLAGYGALAFFVFFAAAACCHRRPLRAEADAFEDPTAVALLGLSAGYHLNS